VAGRIVESTYYLLLALMFYISRIIYDQLTNLCIFTISPKCFLKRSHKHRKFWLTVRFIFL